MYEKTISLYEQNVQVALLFEYCFNSDAYGNYVLTNNNCPGYNR